MVQVRVDIKVQRVLQFVVCWGLREVLLSGYGRGYLSEVVSEFGPLRGPRRRDNLTHWLISTQVQVLWRVDGYYARRPRCENEKEVASTVLFRGFTMSRRWGAVVWWQGGVPDGAGDAAFNTWVSP